MVKFMRNLYSPLVLLMMLALLVPGLLSTASAMRIVPGATYDRADYAWYNSSWAYRQKITINGTTLSGNLTNFPVTVFATNTTFTYSHAQADGDDIRFTDSDGSTLLKYEEDTWAQNATSVWHVKVPTVVNDATHFIYMYYGNPTAADGQDAANVWDANFVAVYHMNDLATTSFADSTSNGVTQTKRAANNPVMVAASGVGAAQHYDGISDYTQNAAMSALSGQTNMTVEAYAQYDTVGNLLATSLVSDHKLQYDCGGGWVAHKAQLYIRDSGGAWATSNAGTTNIDDGSYHYIVGRMTGTTLQVFVNGTSESSNVTGTGILNANNTVFGTGADNAATPAAGGFWDGKISEVRVSKIARTNDWIKATNMALRNTLVTYGAEEGGVASIATGAATDISTGAATINGSVTDIGGGNPTVTVFYGTVDGGTTPANWEFNSTPTTPSQPQGAVAFSLTASGLDYGTTYYYRARAVNIGGTSWSGATGTFDTNAYTGLTPVAVVIPTIVLLGFTLGSVRLFMAGHGRLKDIQRRTDGMLLMGLSMVFIGLGILMFPILMDAINAVVR